VEPDNVAAVSLVARAQALVNETVTAIFTVDNPLAAKADPGLKDQAGKTARDRALGKDQDAIVKLLDSTSSP